MRILPPCLGVLLLCSLPALAREEKPLDLSLVPQEGAAPEKFVPPEWRIEESAKGDLDGNGSEDVVLQLIEVGPKSTDGSYVAYGRALLVLLSEGGKFRRAAASNKVLGCSECTVTPDGEGGMSKMEKGVLVLYQLFNGPEGVELRFRYDPKDKRFVLIEERAFEQVPSAAGDTQKSVTTSPLKGQKVTRTVQYGSGNSKDTVLSSKKQKVPVRRQFLEDVSLETYQQ